MVFKSRRRKSTFRWAILFIHLKIYRVYLKNKESFFNYYEMIKYSRSDQFQKARRLRFHLLIFNLI